MTTGNQPENPGPVEDNQNSPGKLAVLLIGHGSRAEGANEAQYRVARDLRDSGQYPVVECAFLEINRPDIPAGLTLCKEAGASRIVVVPYFLHMGTHVRRDLPRIIGEWWSDNSEIEIVEGQPLGYSPRMTALVEDRIRQALLAENE
jgi:sirohydrochlorin ferrochelatase